MASRINAEHFQGWPGMRRSTMAALLKKGGAWR
jgi:hypothetical protein